MMLHIFKNENLVSIDTEEDALDYSLIQMDFLLGNSDVINLRSSRKIMCRTLESLHYTWDYLGDSYGMDFYGLSIIVPEKTRLCVS